MKLTIKWKIFKEKVNDLIDESDDLTYMEHHNLSNSEVNFICSEVNDWITECHHFLKNAFDSPNNEFAQEFYTVKPYGAYIKTPNKEPEQRLNDAFDRLNIKRKTLESIYRILLVSDAIIQPNLIDLEIRAMYSEHDIKDLILDKLYYLYDNKYYPIQAILNGNGISISNPGEIRELLNPLEKMGIIRATYTNGINVQLCSKGKEQIEDKRRFELITTDYVLNPKIEVPLAISA